MIRKYTIRIGHRKGGPEITKKIPRKLDCTVSEPSSWFQQNETMERGLTFLNENGHPFSSSLFNPIASFHKSKNKIEETEETATLVYDKIEKEYGLDKNDVFVVVAAAID